MSFALLVVGCGGGSSSAASDSTNAISKAAFVKRANAICEKARKDAGKDLQAYDKQHEQAAGKGESRAKITAAGIQATVLPRIEKQNEELEELGTPAGDHSMVDAYLASLQQVVTKGSKGAPIPEAQLQKLFAPSAKSARTYGIEECAYG